ncbi:MAG: hypothetical protein JRF53_00595 [Deltaproteobacteria bacterium]|nr:hypothetical protein [Deltaproteobacteria bacterium]
MSGEIFVGNVEGKSQADGAQTISLGTDDRFREHQIQLEVSATPSAGSLDVSIKTPGATDFASLGNIGDHTIDMTDSTQYILQFKGYATAIKVTPTGFDADKTYSVYVCSGAGV